MITFRVFEKSVIAVALLTLPGLAQAIDLENSKLRAGEAIEIQVDSMEAVQFRSLVSSQRFFVRASLCDPNSSDGKRCLKFGNGTSGATLLAGKSESFSPAQKISISTKQYNDQVKAFGETYNTAPVLRIELRRIIPYGLGLVSEIRARHSISLDSLRSSSSTVLKLESSLASTLIDRSTPIEVTVKGEVKLSGSR